MAGSGGGPYPRRGQQMATAIAAKAKVPGELGRPVELCAHNKALRKLVLEWCPPGHRRAVREAMEAHSTDAGMMRGVLISFIQALMEDHGADAEDSEMDLYTRGALLDKLLGRWLAMMKLETAGAQAVGGNVQVYIDMSGGSWEDPGAGDEVPIGR